MKKDSIELKFPSELIKTRRGTHGKELVYVATPDYIQRLNKVFDYVWDWEINEVIRVDNQLVIRGTLSAGGLKKTAFGGSQIKFRKGTNEYVDLADDYKAAASDALKKTASLFGIGLHLWKDDYEDDPPTQANQSDDKYSPPEPHFRLARTIEAFSVWNITRDHLEDAVGKMDGQWNDEDFNWLSAEYARLKRSKEPNASMLRKKG